MKTIIHTPIATDQNGLAEILDSRGVTIADCWSATDLTRIEGQRVADEITRRVNTHEALVSSLSTLVTMLNKDKDGSYFLCEEASEYVDEANALLASLSTKPTEIIEPENAK